MKDGAWQMALDGARAHQRKRPVHAETDAFVGQVTERFLRLIETVPRSESSTEVVLAPATLTAEERD